MMKWISVRDKLPKENKYVLGIHNRGTWIDDDDPIKVNYVVVKMTLQFNLYYMAQQERVPDECEIVNSIINTQNRDEVINIVKSKRDIGSVCWETFGPLRFGQSEITHWMPLPKPPKV